MKEAAEVAVRRVEQSLVALGGGDEHARHRQARRLEQRDGAPRADEIDEHARRRPVEAEAHDAVDVGDALDHFADAAEPVADVAEDHAPHQLGVGAAGLGEDVERFAGSGRRDAAPSSCAPPRGTSIFVLVALLEEAALVGRLVAEAPSAMRAFMNAGSANAACASSRVLAKTLSTIAWCTSQPTKSMVASGAIARPVCGPRSASMYAAPCVSASCAHSLSTLKPTRLPQNAGVSLVRTSSRPSRSLEELGDVGDDERVGARVRDQLAADDDVGRVEEMDAEKVAREARRRPSPPCWRSTAPTRPWRRSRRACAACRSSPDRRA